MKKIDIIPILALFLGTTLILVAMAMGGNLIIFWSLSSMIITMVGSFLALMASYPFKILKQAPMITKQAFVEPLDNRAELVSLVSNLSRKARSEGLLSLEDELTDIDDEFLTKGLQMVIDGIEPENITQILELEIAAIERRHGIGHSIFKAWAELAPAFGMIGTLIGLITMLSDLSDMSKIGIGMATALITTFYGAFFANMVLTPIANKLQSQTENEIYTREMMIESVLSIQSGINPRIVEEKLKTFLTTKEKLVKPEAVNENAS
ncbi:MAG: MotA/TolQ/ExbB proton channel family protein [Clostridiales bacterium]|nr:MotA/TolQ/ExbB proton channel family protein [Clostridiales bacterium]